jgi:hypothetical protein
MAGNVGLGFGANPIRFPWRAALDILQTFANVMSYTLHGFLRHLINSFLSSFHCHR